MRLVRVIVGLCLGFISVALLLELALHLLPGSVMLVTNDAPGAYPLRPYLPDQTYRYSYGWQMQNVHSGKTNNYGQISPFDFEARSQPVLVLGDSYVESMMNGYQDTLQGQLGRRLGDPHKVYGVGVSAMSISDYGAAILAARTEFEPGALVVVVTDGDISESTVARPGGYRLIPSGSGMDLAYAARTPSRWLAATRAHVGRLAAYDYLRGNLKFSPSDIWKDVASTGKKEPGVVRAEGMAVVADNAPGRATVDWFVDVLARHSGVNPACVVLLFDSDRYALYEAGTQARRKDPADSVAWLTQAAVARGMKVVDLGEVFARDYRRNGMKLDYWPDDRHWNARGHSVAADAAFEALSGDAGSMACPALSGRSSLAR